MAISWTTELEERLLELKDTHKKGYREIAEVLNTTISSVKHKYIRLKQYANEDKHHHPIEKIEQINKCLPNKDKLFILETHAGWGNLTKHYHLFGEVLAHDIDEKKVKYLNSLGYEDFDAVKCDSLKEIHRYVWHNFKFDVIDLDPYGYPSRFFPHVFELIEDGVLFVTFPKMGVQQINKIMKEHYRAFWGITLDDKHCYEEKIHQKIKDFAFMQGRSVQLMDSLDLGRMYRFAYQVKKESMLDLVGLEVKRAVEVS